MAVSRLGWGLIPRIEEEERILVFFSKVRKILSSEEIQKIEDKYGAALYVGKIKGCAGWDGAIRYI